VQIISRHEAKAVGLRHYFTGKPCRRGHVDRRRVNDKTCIACDRARVRPDNAARCRARYLAQRAEYIAAAKAYTEANRAKVRERRRKHREANKERLYAETSAWAKTFPEKRRAGERNREAQERGASGKHTFADIQDIGRMQGWQCANPLCRIPVGDGYHVDHIVPIALGGSNGRRNIQLLCAPCNQSKHALDPIEWAQTQGLLL
jgi:5-methylcytosine-specific restriction endonuclease McrA